jgi:hypothetical protein
VVPGPIREVLSMISLIPPKDIKSDPSGANLEGKLSHLHQTVALSPIEEGEYILVVITKVIKESKTWYSAQVLKKFPDRIKASYYTTITPSLPKYNKATYA